MKLTGKMAGILGGSALLVGLAASPANATTIENHYPETPALNPTLPIVNTYHGSDHIKPNVLNPHPVCNALEDRRTVVYKVNDNFSPVGTISTTNHTTKDIPLTQETSKSQTINISVNGEQGNSTTINAGASKDGGTFGIAEEISKKIGFEASYQLSWNAGQTIGPYDVPPGYTGEATYGFRTVTMSGTQQICGADGRWTNPTAWNAFVPVKNEVEVKLYNNPADS
ncbi:MULTISPECIES: hypothetical protein [Micrococcaceae]|uniref:hypothetical protein n=1 Tax=unclassified Kocuria TaxID=2649579 RepID=UPI0010128CEC|nr:MULTISPECIES: hypothetical protein [unclassified Kocuria]